MPITNQNPRWGNYVDKPGRVDGNIKRFCWEAGEICWDDNPFCWDDVAIILELVAAGNGKVIKTDEGWLDSYKKLDKKKQKRFIELATKIRGEHTIRRQKKEIKDVTLTANDIKMTVNKVLKSIQVEVIKK